jgi:hypothetical protein
MTLLLIKNENLFNRIDCFRAKHQSNKSLNSQKFQQQILIFLNSHKRKSLQAPEKKFQTFSKSTTFSLIIFVPFW